MSKNVQSVILSSAFAGLLAGAVACGGKTEKPVEGAAPAAEKVEAPAPTPTEEVEPTEAPVDGDAAVPTDVTTGEQPAAIPAHECKGKNECKGQGGCAVAGQNDCKGKNECKGKGGCKTS
jgi:hypothetical protein